jgi:hypothetical protein
MVVWLFLIVPLSLIVLGYFVVTGCLASHGCSVVKIITGLFRLLEGRVSAVLGCVRKCVYLQQ